MGWYIVLDDSEDVENILEIARRIDRRRLRELALFFGSPEKCEECGTILDDMISAYDEIPSEDATCYITDWGDQKALAQLASGGGNCRYMKNAVRTAFISLIISDRAHHEYDGSGVDVDMNSGIEIHL